MMKADHALGVVLCLFSFSCGFDELDTLHQDLPEFYALDLSPGCFVPMKSTAGDQSLMLRVATMEMALLNIARSLEPLQDFSQNIEEYWQDGYWEYVSVYAWGTSSLKYQAESGGNAVRLSGRGAPGQDHGDGQTTQEIYTELNAERVFDDSARAFFLELTQVGTSCIRTQAANAQSVCTAHDFKASLHFDTDGIQLKNYWHKGSNIGWTKHALVLENTNNDSTFIMGCDPETDVSFVKRGSHYMCWDAGGYETSCCGVNLWPID